MFELMRQSNYFRQILKVFVNKLEVIFLLKIQLLKSLLD